jgi:hypothetical protein
VHQQQRDPWSAGRHLDPWFEQRFGSTWAQRIAKTIAVVVVVGLVAFLFGWGLNKAVAAEPQSSTRACVTPEQNPCPPPAKFAARKYRHGKMGYATHSAAWFFHGDRAVKQVIKHKIQHRLERIAATHPARRQSLRSASFYLHQLWDGAKCDGHGSYNPYAWGFDICNYAGPSPLTVKEQVQSSGALIICGGGVAFAWADGAGVYVLGLMGTSCTWAFWMGFD